MDGVLIINKPKGYTSHDIVNIVKKQLNITKVGHAGTLDPMATGVLIILLGEATKLSNYLMNHDKEYIATLKLGKRTDTLDSEGQIIEEKEIPALSKENINEVLLSFLGKSKQIPPMYSAIKINGKKLYELARKGEEIERKEREIEIYEIEFIKLKEENNKVSEIEFKVNCSKGTYIRTLCEDIAERLGTIRIYERIKKNQSW